MNAPSDFLGNLYEPYEKLLRKIQKPENNPDTIYHYTSASGLNEILRTSKLWFTSIAFVKYLDSHQRMEVQCLSFYTSSEIQRALY